MTWPAGFTMCDASMLPAPFGVDGPVPCPFCGAMVRVRGEATFPRWQLHCAPKEDA